MASDVEVFSRWVAGLNGAATALLTVGYLRIRRGDRVIVVTDKDPQTRTYTKRDGTQGESIEIDARDVGPALSRGTATLRKAERVGEAQTDPAFDPWAKPATDVPF